METGVYHVGEDCFGVKLSLILGKMNSTDRREEKRNFLIQGRRFRRSFKNYCNYRYFMKLSRLLSIVKLGIDVLLSEHLQSRCIDSSMYRYTPNIWRGKHKPTTRWNCSETDHNCTKTQLQWNHDSA